MGQHHLTRPELCLPVVEYLSAGTPPDGVVEIGPGGGVLTDVLAAQGWRVLAVELDREWAFELRRRLAGAARPPCQLVIGDALDLRFAGLAGERRGEGRGEGRGEAREERKGESGGATWALAGNLPYSVSTAIVERVLDDAPAGCRCAFLVQKEVADRLLAEPGSRIYGSLSVLVALRARGRRLARVRPGSFSPPPKVDSAFVGLEVIEGPASVDWHHLKRTVRAAFAQRRKTLANGLAASFGAERTRSALERSGLDGGLRAEALAPADFLDLHRALHPPDGRWSADPDAHG